MIVQRLEMLIIICLLLCTICIALLVTVYIAIKVNQSRIEHLQKGLYKIKAHLEQSKLHFTSKAETLSVNQAKVELNQKRIYKMVFDCLRNLEKIETIRTENNNSNSTDGNTIHNNIIKTPADFEEVTAKKYIELLINKIQGRKNDSV